MKNTWSENVDNILKCGIFLENLGIKNWALPEKNVLQALEKLFKIGVGVLGGDVYIIEKDSTINPTYDSWYCNRENSEDDISFVSRSILRAKNYITNYQQEKSNKLFTLVPDV